MKLPLFPFLQYIEYYLEKEDEYSLHSPFAYRIYLGLKAYYSHNVHRFPAIEGIRKALLRDKRKLNIMDLGAGSQRFSSSKRKVSDIVKYSSSSQKHALLYQYFCSLTPAQTVIELGTGLGLNSCYLAEATKGKLFTFEGAEALLNRAKANLTAYGHIQVIPGDISKTLPEFLEQNPKVDFAFMDANHTYEHTIRYFNLLVMHTHETSILIIGDIHWSRGMNRAWREIISSERIRLSLDFYECGVLFFRDGLDKAHYVLDY